MSQHTRSTIRKGGLAGLLALALLIGSITAGSPAHADEPAAVFYGYVIPQDGGAMPKRVRALSGTGVVCGSAEVLPTVSQTAGFYAMSVIADAMKPGCPVAGEAVRFVLVYGMIDESIVVGAPATYAPGVVTPLNLVRTAADQPLALP